MADKVEAKPERTPEELEKRRQEIAARVAAFIFCVSVVLIFVRVVLVDTSAELKEKQAAEAAEKEARESELKADMSK